MKEGLQKLSLNTIEIHVPDFDFDIDSGSDGHAAATTEDNVATRPDEVLQCDFKHNQYQL